MRMNHKAILEYGLALPTEELEILIVVLEEIKQAVFLPE